MNTSATRQDLQNALDRTRSSIMGSMLSRNDLQGVISQVRAGLLHDLHALHAENQVAMRQAVNARAQLMQRLGSLENSVARMEQLLNQLISQQSRTSTTIQRMQPVDSGYLFQRV